MPDSAHDQLVFHLNKAARFVASLYKPFLGNELTVAQYLALLVIHQKDGVSVSALGDEIGTDSSTVTPMIHKLTALGAVEKLRDPEDERVVRLRLTDAGRTMVLGHRGVWRKVESAVSLSDQELATLRLLLIKMLIKSR
jgi:DNA-binding MarR family transcriptional regulator